MSTTYGLLRYTLPNQPSRERPLNAPTLTIGQGEDNDLIFPWPGVLPHHGRLESTPTATTIAPAVAGAPILLNNQLITSPTKLHAGDVIQLGEGRLLFAAPAKSHPTLLNSPDETLAGGTAVANEPPADWASHTTIVRHSEPTIMAGGGRTTPTDKPEKPAPPPPPKRNVRTIGRYEMQDMLGYRGYLVVYRGYDPQLDRTVALKLLSTQFPADDDLRAKIRREVELIAGLEHPNVVQVYDYGEHNKQPYVVMPFLDAGTLTLRLQTGGPMHLKEIAPIFDELGAAVDSAHHHGLIHGQLNPNNILFDTQNKTYVSDFGIATIASAFVADTQASYDWAHYISPEQAQGLLSHNEALITSRSDIYSLGVILFEMLTGKTPYQGESALELAEAHLNSPVPQLAQFAPHLPREYQFLFDRALAKDPTKRYPSAARLAQHVRETAAGRWYLSQLAELSEDLPRPVAIPPVRVIGGETPLNLSLNRPTVTEEDILSASMPEPLANLPAGTPVGRYIISQLVGQGGMAAVYLAHDPGVDRSVAIKMLPPNLLQRPRFRDLFHHEARLIARLRHPHIVSVFDFGEHENQPYLVMQYLPGGTLVERLTHGALTIQAINAILGNVAKATDEAHQQGIIHRDIKPANILFNAEQEAFLSDFGIAVLSAAADDKSHFAGGTPRYMSPEQAQAVLANKPVAVDSRSDIYSLGVVLFHMLTGQVPFLADNKPIPMMQAHISEPIPSLRRYAPTLPTAWQEIINRALAKEPAKRYQTAAELAQDVREVSTGRWYLRQLME